MGFFLRLRDRNFLAGALFSPSFGFAASALGSVFAAGLASDFDVAAFVFGAFLAVFFAAFLEVFFVVFLVIFFVTFLVDFLEAALVAGFFFAAGFFVVVFLDAAFFATFFLVVFFAAALVAFFLDLAAVCLGAAFFETVFLEVDFLATFFVTFLADFFAVFFVDFFVVFFAKLHRPLGLQILNHQYVGPIGCKGRRGGGNCQNRVCGDGQNGHSGALSGDLGGEGK